jgi:SAP domain
MNRFKMPELKLYLKSENMPLGGKKADLVQRIKDHFE